jgi:uncharacterized protein YndB with AHSA1/START domain
MTMSPTGALTVTASSDREIVMTRAFDAPRHLVFDAWTKPELLTGWLGVRGGWTFAVCEVDLKVGGKYRFVWRKPGQPELGMGGEYVEIVAPERLVTTEVFDQPWYPGEGLNTLVLTEEDGKTVATLTVRYESTEARDAVLASPMEKGVAESYDTLDAILPTL